MVRIRRTRDGDKACLQVPAENDLRRGFSVFAGQLRDYFIAEALGSMASPPERIPGFYDYAVLSDVFMKLCDLGNKGGSRSELPQA